MEGLGLRLRFDTDEPEFARGFEAGRIWEILNTHPDEELTFTVHATNAEMLIRMAEDGERAVRSNELGEPWIEIIYGPEKIDE